MRLIDADALYEKTAEWEARALAVVEKLNEKPFEEMDANEITEWRKWSCILGERSAFKHDVADAPTIEPERKTGRWIPVTEALPHTDDKVLCCTMTKKGVSGIVIGYYLRGEHGCSWACGMNSNVVAWMPLPEPWKGAQNG